MRGLRDATFSSGSMLRPQMVTSIPAPARLSAIACPIPVPPPVTNACLNLVMRKSPNWGGWPSSHLPRHQLRPAFGEAVELVAAGQVRVRPGHALVAELRGRMQRPVGIREVRAGEADEVG